METARSKLFLARKSLSVLISETSLPCTLRLGLVLAVEFWSGFLLSFCFNLFSGIIVVVLVLVLLLTCCCCCCSTFVVVVIVFFFESNLFSFSSFSDSGLSFFSAALLLLSSSLHFLLPYLQSIILILLYQLSWLGLQKYNFLQYGTF